MTKQYEDALVDFEFLLEVMHADSEGEMLQNRTYLDNDTEETIISVLQDKISGRWQDISTAPKDGTPILGCTVGTTPVTCFWDDRKDEFVFGMEFGEPVRGGCYFVTKPTHWRPLHQPPKGEE